MTLTTRGYAVAVSSIFFRSNLGGLSWKPPLLFVWPVSRKKWLDLSFVFGSTNESGSGSLRDTE